MLTVDFDKAYRQAAEMAQVAHELFEQSDRLIAVTNGVRGIWSGESADTYLAKLESLAETLKQNAKGCSDAADEFYALIAEIQAAEAEAQNIIATVSIRGA